MSVELTDKFFNEVAGWQAVKQARAYLAQGQVVSSNWSPPLLRGVVRVGEIFFPDGEGHWPVRAILRGVGRVAASTLKSAESRA